MAQTRPSGEQLRFRSSRTGEHILDDYLEATEKGNRSLPDLMEDLWTPTGRVREDIFEWRVRANMLQTRTGDFTDPEAGWVNVTTYFADRGVFAAGTAYSNFDVVTLADTSVYLVNGLTTATKSWPTEADFTLDAATTRLIDVTRIVNERTLAETARTGAEAAQTAAATSETNAGTSATNAAGSATLSSRWAEEADNIDVNGVGTRSSRHHARQAGTSASSASTSATNAATSETNAASSATAAETARTGAETARTGAEAALDSFDDRYLGAKTGDPTTDNDGGTLLVGALYFNTTSNKMRVWRGTVWDDASIDQAAVAITGGTIDGITRLGVNGDATATRQIANGGEVFSLAPAAGTAHVRLRRHNPNLDSLGILFANDAADFLILQKYLGDGTFTWTTQIRMNNDDVLLNGATRAPDSMSIMNRERGDARYLQLGGGSLTGSLRVMTQMFVRSPTSTGNAHYWLESDTGLYTGLIYAPPDHSGVHFRKYNTASPQATTAQLSLYDGDVRIHYAGGGIVGDSVVSITRGDARYVRSTRLGAAVAASVLSDGSQTAPAGHVVYGKNGAGTWQCKPVQVLLNGTWTTISG